MIRRQEFLTWLNCCTFAQTLERVDTFADCLAWGLVAVVANRDDFEMLTTTPEGAAATLPLLDLAAA